MNDLQSTAMKVDPSMASDVTCNSCGNYTFQEVLLMKKFSVITSPTGKEAYAPMPVFACAACGHVNSEFIMPNNKQNETSTKPHVSLGV